MYSKKIKKKNKKKIVFVSGNFNVLHPGHTRLLRFAKECGDFLIVGVEGDSSLGNLTHVNEDTRLEVVAANNWVDQSFIIKGSIEEEIEKIKPDIVVKGKEHQYKFNIEEKIVKKIGAKLIFSSGETTFSSIDLLSSNLGENQILSFKAYDFLKRHSLDKNNLKKIINNFKNISTCVIGDLIIDEYITCDAVGLSQEEPTLVVKPVDTKKFIGGAGIVALHSSSLGSKTNFFSIAGNDDLYNFSIDVFKDKKVDYFIESDESRPTTLKKRFRSGGKSLLRVNYLHQDIISKKIQKNLLDRFKRIMNDLDLLVFSDFSYGCLPRDLINEIIELAKKNKIIIASDSQSSSQIGDITKFKNSDLICVTEREARMAVKNFDDGLVILLDKLREEAKSKNIILKLGEEGALVQSEEQINQNWIVDKIISQNSNPVDVSGAGDSMLISSALSLASGANIWEASVIGSIAASIQISRIGNVPIKQTELLKYVNLI